MDKLTKEQLEKYLYIDNQNIGQIAEYCCCDITTVQRYMKKFGLKKHHTADKFTKEQLEEDIFILGLSRYQMSDKYGIGVFTVDRCLRKHNIVIPKELRVPSAKVRRLILDEVIITPRQHSILIGSILGDGSIGKDCRSKNGNSSFCFSQTTRRLSYVKYIAKELKPFSSRIYKGKDNYCFDTVNIGAFNRYYDMFRTKDRTKIVPEDIQQHLDVLALTAWFEQDGCAYKNNSSIATCSFTTEECELLIDALERNFDIKSYIWYQKSQSDPTKYYPIVSFRSPEHRKLHKLIDPFMHPCFEYKKLSENRSSETVRRTPFKINEDEDTGQTM